MIESLFKDTCTVQRADATSDYGGVASDAYTTLWSYVPCLLIETTGETERKGEAAINTVVDGYLRIQKEIRSRDRIIINGRFYDVLNVRDVLDLITEQVDYWQGSVVKMTLKTDEDANLMIVE